MKIILPRITLLPRFWKFPQIVLHRVRIDFLLFLRRGKKVKDEGQDYHREPAAK